MDRPQTIILDGDSLTRADVAKVAYGARVALDGAKLGRIRRTMGEQSDMRGARGGEARGRAETRDDSAPDVPGVDEPLAIEVVRAMLVIHINALLRGHSGVHVGILGALADMLDRGVIPVIPAGAATHRRGDPIPAPHLAKALSGGGEAYFEGARIPTAEALQRAGLKPISLSSGEALALANSSTEMLAVAILALEHMQRLLRTADVAAAMGMDCFGLSINMLDDNIDVKREVMGRAEATRHMRRLLEGSTSGAVPCSLAPRLGVPTSTAGPAQHDIAWNWIAPAQRCGREAFQPWYLPADSEERSPPGVGSLHATPRVHGAVRDAVDLSCRVVDGELDSGAGTPCVFPDVENPPHDYAHPGSAGAFHDIPLALAMGYVRAAMPVLAAISGQRIARLTDAAGNAGLFTIIGLDTAESGFRDLRDAATARVNDLATRAHPSGVHSAPTSSDIGDRAAIDVDDMRQILVMTDNLAHVLALELYTATWVLEYRREALGVACDLARQGSVDALLDRIHGAPAQDSDAHAVFLADVMQLMHALADAEAFRVGDGVAKACAIARRHVGSTSRDLPSGVDMEAIRRLVVEGAFAL